MIQLRSRRNHSRHTRPAGGPRKVSDGSSQLRQASVYRRGPTDAGAARASLQSRFSLSDSGRASRRRKSSGADMVERRPWRTSAQSLNFSRLLDFRQGGGRLQAAGEFQIHHRRFGILGIRAAFRQDLRQSDYAPSRLPPASAVIDENPVARAHFADGFDRLRIGDAVPQLYAFRAPGRRANRFRGRFWPGNSSWSTFLGSRVERWSPRASPG